MAQKIGSFIFFLSSLKKVDELSSTARNLDDGQATMTYEAEVSHDAKKFCFIWDFDRHHQKSVYMTYGFLIQMQCWLKKNTPIFR